MDGRQCLAYVSLTQFATGNHACRDRPAWMLDTREASGSPWRTVGAVDLYDFEPRQLRAGVAVHIDADARRSGHAQAGLSILQDHASSHLGLRQLYAEVPANHEASLGLFQKAGYRATGRREQWIRTPQGGWSDVVTLQLFLDENRLETPRS